MPISLATVFLVALATTVLLIPLLISLFSSKSLVDRKASRKIHVREVPTMGGVGIFMGFIITLLLLEPFSEIAIHRVELLTLSVMFVVGLRDDLIELSALSKLLAQLLPVFLLVYLGDLYFPSLFGFLTIREIPTWLGMLIAGFTIVGLTNSFNLIDGLDGLAGSLALVASLLFGLWFYIQGATFYAVMAFSFAGAVSGLLYFNWQPARIFMGDTGALVIGFFLAILAIRFININEMLPAGSPYKFQSPVAIALAVLIVPVFDTIRIIIVRLLMGRSPFAADKNHTHHLLLRLGLSHAQTTLILVFANLLFVGLVLWLDPLGNNWVVLAMLLSGGVISLIMSRLIQRKKQNLDAAGRSKQLQIIKNNRQAS